MSITVEKNDDLIELSNDHGPGRLVGVKNDVVVGTVVTDDGRKSQVMWSSEPLTRDERIIRGIKDQVQRIFDQQLHTKLDDVINDRVRHAVLSHLENLRRRGTLHSHSVTYKLDPTYNQTVFDVQVGLNGSLKLTLLRYFLNGR